MRNFEERKAEVFRRSEKRIRERKQRRNHILMTCIPLVLCVTIFGALFHPKLDYFKSAPEGSDELLYSGMGTEAVGGSFTGSVEVSGNGITSHYSKEADVQKIIGLINGIVAIPETDTDGSKDSDLTTNENFSTEQKGDQEDKGYTIRVKRSDGSTAEYLLIGSLLIDQTTQQEYPISADTIKDLKNSLGIPLN